MTMMSASAPDTLLVWGLARGVADDCVKNFPACLSVCLSVNVHVAAYLSGVSLGVEQINKVQTNVGNALQLSARRCSGWNG